MTRPTINYFSDVLCIWSYISQIRLEQLAKEFEGRIDINEQFVSVFPDARTKTAATWKDKGGYESMNKLFQRLSRKYDHITVHPDVWTVTQPYTSTVIHQTLKAFQAAGQEDGDADLPYIETLGARAIKRFRQAFFAEARDISNWEVQAELAKEIGVDPARIEAKRRSGEAAALLDADLKHAESLGVKGSPTFVMNEGRQVLFGNVGYKLIQANVEELFRDQPGDAASWC